MKIIKTLRVIVRYDFNCTLGSPVIKVSPLTTRLCADTENPKAKRDKNIRIFFMLLLFDKYTYLILEYCIFST